MIRETLEETGIIVKEPKFCGILTESSPTNYNWISYIFSNEIEYINPPISDEGKLEWIEYDKIKKYLPHLPIIIFTNLFFKRKNL